MKSSATTAVNRKALHDYTVIERIEAGLVLKGTEVKSIRAGAASLAGGFARIEDGELLLRDVHISPYEHGGKFNHDPLRPRRLLLHKRELANLETTLRQKGLSLIPLKLYFKRGIAKIELGLCRGKGFSDKRDALRRKTAENEARRAMSR